MLEARDDIRLAASWYNDQRKGLGKLFLDRVRACVSSLKPNPYICQVRYRNVHTALVEQFPYMVHYTIDDGTMTIYIIAVIHTSQNPGLWDEKT